MLLRIILLTSVLLSGCSYSKRIEALEESQKKIIQGYDSNFQNIGGKLQIIIEEVFKESMKKGRAAKCPNGFNFTNGICFEVKK